MKIVTYSIKGSIWDKEFNLPIKYENSKNNEITDLQDKAISEFINNGFRHIDDMIYNVKEFIYGEIETHKDINNKLHIDMSLYNPNEGKKTLDKLIPNIFKIVKPRSIFVRDTKSTRIVIIDCSYKGETERGIGFCIVYKNGKFDTLGEGPKEDYHE